MNERSRADADANSAMCYFNAAQLFGGETGAHIGRIKKDTSPISLF